jgi:hypothetical protein
MITSDYAKFNMTVYEDFSMYSDQVSIKTLKKIWKIVTISIFDQDQNFQQKFDFH